MIWSIDIPYLVNKDNADLGPKSALLSLSFKPFSPGFIISVCLSQKEDLLPNWMLCSRPILWPVGSTNEPSLGGFEQTLLCTVHPLCHLIESS